jgi:arabinogalactan endo-1,4-beta-galactosidase
MLTNRRIFIGALLWLVPLVAPGQDAPSTPLKVLFIGNSYTSVNDLPAMVTALAEATGGRKIEVDRHLVGGCTLEKHVQDQKAIDKIRATRWDVVVLQEQSLRPVIDRQAMHEYARLLDAEIKQQGAKTVFYLTWARQHIPDMQEGADPAKSSEYAEAMYQMNGAAKTLDFETWLQQQKTGLADGLNGAYLDIAKELGAGVAPVGVAWKMALAADPPFVLHRPDESHPNPTGTYLAACVFYATLFDKSPVGLPGTIKHGDKVLADIPDYQAKRLQEISWAAVKSDSRPVAQPPFILGADISWVQEQEDQGTPFSDHGQQQDILVILKDHGFNWIRLRVFVNPQAPKGYSDRGYCDLEHTLAMARRIKTAGMGFLLDFHYSDTWADPGHQVKPAAWADLHGADLENAVHDYTRDVIAALKQQGTAPDIVQIGNEISNGFLWPDGKVWETKDWEAFCGLVKAGIAGAKEADPKVKTMIHLAWGGQNKQSRSFLDKALAQEVEFDVLGQSYYPKWHGTLDDLKSNLTDLAGRYKLDIMLVEYSVPNIREINDVVHGLPSGKGLGTFIWEPTKWEGPALFDGKGNTKPEIDVYPKMAEEYGLKDE